LEEVTTGRQRVWPAVAEQIADDQQLSGFGGAGQLGKSASVVQPAVRLAALECSQTAGAPRIASLVELSK
jgi:hypothetical protein